MKQMSSTSVIQVALDSKMGFPGDSLIKNVPVNAGDMWHGFNLWVGKIP